MTPRRLMLLFLGMNIFNYVDRQMISGIFPLLQQHFGLSDTALGLLGSAFMISYTFTAVPFGFWSDRWLPHKVAAIGVAVWSLATMSSALAWSFLSLFLLRTLVGVGEAAYTSTAGTILSRNYPEGKRASALGLLNLGLPIGGAIGVVLGGYIGQHYGWKPAFLIVGVPGLILAWLAWRIPNQRVVRREPLERQIRVPDIWKLLREWPYLMTALGYAGISFTFGAIVYFAPTFFQRDYGYSLTHATLLTGAIEVGAGLLGAPVGGWVADFWRKRHPKGRAYTLVFAMFASALTLGLGLYLHTLSLFFLAVFFMMWHVGVASALIFDVTESFVWNTASALAMFLMHLLGDMFSPTITGLISDHSNLLTAFYLLTVPMAFAAVCFLGTAAFLGHSRKTSISA